MQMATAMIKRKRKKRVQQTAARRCLHVKVGGKAVKAALLRQRLNEVDNHGSSGKSMGNLTTLSRAEHAPFYVNIDKLNLSGKFGGQSKLSRLPRE